LISCGGNGWVRFWDVKNAKLKAEFIAHTKGILLNLILIIEIEIES
jgi:hypothetical protein